MALTSLYFTDTPACIAKAVVCFKGLGHLLVLDA